MGWDRSEDGDLIRAAERDRFDVLITNDKRMLHQQNNAKRKIALVQVEDGRWLALQAANEAIRLAVEASTPGSFLRVPKPKLL